MLRFQLLFVLALSCAPASPSEVEETAMLASNVQTSEFGVRVLVDADVWDGSCTERKGTAPGPQPHFGEIGRTSAEFIADCGGPFFGPYARGAVSLQTRDEARVWHMEAEAISSFEGSASANVYFFDVVSVNSAGPGNDHDDLVHLKLRVPFVGEIENAPGVEYSGFIQVFLLDPATGTIQRFFSTRFFYESTNGSEGRTEEVDLPAVPVGTRLFINTGFLFALSVSPDVSTPPKRASVQADFNVCPADLTPGAKITMASGAVGECEAKGDIGVATVDVIQSVAGVAMVAGKDAVVRVDLTNTFTDSVEATVTLDIAQPGIQFSQRVTETITIPGNCPRKTYYFPSPIQQDACGISESLGGLKALGAAPRRGSPLTVKVNVRTSTPDTDATNDDGESAALPVFETALSIAYGKIECPACPLPTGGVGSAEVATADMLEAIRWSDRHVLAMFPLAPEGYQSEVITDLAGSLLPIKGSTSCPPDLSLGCGMDRDMRELVKAARSVDPFVKRIVGFVPPGYFQLHGAPVGFRVSGVASGIAALVDADFPSGNLSGRHDPTVPHELVHTLSSRFFDDVHLPPEAVSGYWVGCRGAGFSSCVVPESSQNLMVDVGTLQLEPPATWVEFDVYAHNLFPALDVEKDPAVLFLSASWSTGGVVTIEHLVEFPEARVDRPMIDSGNYAIEVVDAAGNILLTHHVHLSFRQFWRGASSTPKNVHGVAFNLEYPLEAASVRFRHHGRIVHSLDPLAGTLREAIAQIPNDGFSKTPKQRRDALLHKVDAFEKAVADGDPAGALEKLRHDIRKHTNDWVVEYPAPPGVLSRARVLRTIDQVDLRLRTRMSVE